MAGNGDDAEGSVPSNTPSLLTKPADNNTVNVNSGGTVNGAVFGGAASSSLANTSANNNAVNVNSGGTITNNAYGGFAVGNTSAEANGNTVTVNSGSTINQSVYGGYAQANGAGSVATASGNQVVINGGSVGVNVYGGSTSSGSYSATLTATGNTVTLNGNPTIAYGIYGGTGTGSTGDLFTGNTLNLNGAASALWVENFEFINFGASGTANITTLYTTPTGSAQSGVILDTQGNTIDFGGTMTGSGSMTKTGAGTLTLSGTNTYSGGTTISDGVLQIGNGGTTGSISGNITNNAALVFNRSDTVTYTDTISGSGLTSLKSGTLDLSGGGSLSTGLALYDSTIFKGGSGATVSLPRLDVHGSASYEGNLNLANGTLNFYVPSTMNSGNTLLSVVSDGGSQNGNANIDNATVHVGIEGGKPTLQAGQSVILIGQSVILIDAAGTLSANGINTTASRSTAMGTQGVTVDYTFTLSTATDAVTGHQQLLAKLQEETLNPQTKALSEGFLSGLAHVRQGQETLLNLLDSQNASRRSGQEFSALARLQGGSARHDSGSSIRVNSRYLSIGALWQPERNERLSLAGLLELGEGDYHSRNHFDNRASVKGRGDMESAGAAVLARWNVPEMAQNVWLETSVRGGHIRQDFKTHDLVSVSGRPGNYHLSTSYWGAHVGIGNRWEVAPGQEFDARAQLLWSQEKGKSVTLKSGDPVKFRTTDSERLILGGRYNWKVEDSTKLFAGLAWEHEFSAKAKATAYNLYAIDAPDLKGSTGVAEFGVSHQTGRLKLDAGVNASGGKREGIGGFVQANWKF